MLSRCSVPAVNIPIRVLFQQPLKNRTMCCIQQDLMEKATVMVTFYSVSSFFWSPDWNMFRSIEPSCWDFCDLPTLPHSIIKLDLIFHFAPVSVAAAWLKFADILKYGDTSPVSLTFHSPYRSGWHLETRQQLTQQVPSLLPRSKLIGWISPGLTATANNVWRGLRLPGLTGPLVTVYDSVTDAFNRHKHALVQTECEEQRSDLLQLM